MASAHFLFLILPAIAVAEDQSGFFLSRDPEQPPADVQYKLVLDTPKTECAAYKKISPVLANGELLISSSHRVAGHGCKWIWILQSKALPKAYLPELELESKSGVKSKWAKPAKSLEEAVGRAPDSYKHEPPCPEFRAVDYNCKFKKTNEEADLPFDVLLADDGEYYAVYTRERYEGSLLKELAGKKSKVDGKVIDFAKMTGLTIPPESRLYRCKGDSLFLHNFTDNGEGLRELHKSGSKITVKGSYFRVACKQEVPGVCLPKTTTVSHEEIDVECTIKAPPPPDMFAPIKL